MRTTVNIMLVVVRHGTDVCGRGHDDQSGELVSDSVVTVVTLKTIAVVSSSNVL